MFASPPASASSPSSLLDVGCWTLDVGRWTLDVRLLSPPAGQQDQNNDNDSDDGDIAADIDDDPPEWFLEDHEGHSLADSYKVYGFLTLDTFYTSTYTQAVAESLMHRRADEELL